MSGYRAMLLGVVALVLVIGAVALLRYMTTVPGASHKGPLPSLTADEAAIADRLRAHIAAIASRPHNIRHYAELEKAARYIEAELKALGYEPVAQIYTADEKQVRNIEVTIEPADPAKSRGTIVLGAHYDSAGDAPGANDNGSGSAVVMELARLLGDLRNRIDVRLRLVLFVNEEPPYFQTPAMGSWQYARLLAERRERIVGMISLETLGVRGVRLSGPDDHGHRDVPLSALPPTDGHAGQGRHHETCPHHARRRAGRARDGAAGLADARRRTAAGRQSFSSLKLARNPCAG